MGLAGGGDLPENSCCHSELAILDYMTKDLTQCKSGFCILTAFNSLAAGCIIPTNMNVTASKTDISRALRNWRSWSFQQESF